MGIFDIFKSKQQSNPVPQTTQPSDPLVMEPFQVETGRLVDSRTQRASNRYTEADALVNMDERLWSVIELAAVMVRKSYNGISLKPEGNEPIPQNMSNAEVISSSRSISGSIANARPSSTLFCKP